VTSALGTMNSNITNLWIVKKERRQWSRARAGRDRPVTGGGDAALRADAAIVRGIAWVGPGGVAWSSL
jgi:hypothetical protein